MDASARQLAVTRSPSCMIMIQAQPCAAVDILKENNRIETQIIANIRNILIADDVKDKEVSYLKSVISEQRLFHLLAESSRELIPYTDTQTDKSIEHRTEQTQPILEASPLAIAHLDPSVRI
uniref:Uncharacterized protein n=1 Tax=Vespula pensylvanica TaxID=30213 RepID=A0A834P1I2_VESPE|nr:hypothetical protein H0235_009168 [Vespula pensylvanica]